MALTAIAAYDIAHDSRRARVAAVLQAWGDRIQRSVYILTLPPDEVEGVLDSVREILEPTVDSFVLVRQCGPCRDQTVTMGQMRVPEPSLFWAAF